MNRTSGVKESKGRCHVYFGNCTLRVEFLTKLELSNDRIVELFRLFRLSAKINRKGQINHGKYPEPTEKAFKVHSALKVVTRALKYSGNVLRGSHHVIRNIQPQIIMHNKRVRG